MANGRPKQTTMITTIKPKSPDKIQVSLSDSLPMPQRPGERPRASPLKRPGFSIERGVKQCTLTVLLKRKCKLLIKAQLRLRPSALGMQTRTSRPKTRLVALRQRLQPLATVLPVVRDSLL